MVKLAWKVLEKISSTPTAVFTLQQLAELYSVTPRTIRNYIKTINSDYPNLIIINKEKVCLNQNTNHTLKLTDFEESRTSILFRELVKNKNVDYYDFAAKEYIEIPTVEKDIVTLRRTLKDFSVELVKDGATISLVGTEHDFRRAISSLLKGEMNKKLYNLEVLKKCYSTIDVYLLESMLKKQAKKHSLVINAYAQFDILLHLCISITRANEIEDTKNLVDETNYLKSAYITGFIDDVIYELKSLFSVDLNTYEKKYLSYLFASRIAKMSLISDSLNKDYLNDSISAVISTALNRASGKFYLEFNKTDLIDKLNIHIQSLIERTKKQQVIKNPFTENLKNQFPLVYEISVYIASELQKMLDILITEDEISFFALHIGSFILQNDRFVNALNGIIVYPQYNEMQNEFARKIQNVFTPELKIIQIVDEMTSLVQQNSIDIIISIIPLLNIRDVVYVSPLLNRADIKSIETAMETKRKEKSALNIKDSFVQLLSEDFFMKNIYFDTEQEYIVFMCNQLKNSKIVDDKFLHSTLAREDISSTAFNNIVAIPHALEMTAKKTAISIVVNEQPISWGKSRVNIVILLALSKHDLEQFYDIFDSLISLFSKVENITPLIKANDYFEFVNRIVQLLN